MAIIFTKQPSTTGFYPGLNDSFIEFKKDIGDSNRAVITFSPPPLTETFTFTLYPDKNWKYLFNLKEIARIMFNNTTIFPDVDRYRDQNEDRTVYFKSNKGLVIQVSITIDIYYNEIDEVQSGSFLWSMYKGIKQVGETIHSNNYEFLTYSEDGVSHELTYFEGFPFSLDIKHVSNTDKLFVKSVTTGYVTNEVIPSASGSFRFNIDNSNGDNWTNQSVLALIEGRNELELFTKSGYKSNLYLWKVKKCSGIYLKWWNRNGGYSYYLFDEYYKEETAGKDIESVLNNSFNNIESVTGYYDSVGKEAETAITAKANFDAWDYENLKDLFISPCVQMYTSQDENVEGRFIDVSVNGSITYFNKKNRNKISVKIVLPGLNTASL